MVNKILQSLRQAFLLTNKSWEIYLFGLIFYLPLSISNYLGDSAITTIVEIVGFITLPIAFGYYLSTPLFLLQKQENKLQFIEILSVTLQNAKRLIVPTILFIVGLAVLVVILAIAVTSIGGTESFTQLLSSFNKFEYVIPFLIASAFLSFTAVYFSIEKNGILRSIKNSVGFSFKHVYFVCVLSLLGIFYSLVPSKLNEWIPGMFGNLLETLVDNYLGLLFTAVTLIFYQSTSKSTKPSK